MKDRSDRKLLIRCPNHDCRAEYLPAEIYLPNSFLGRPSYIEKSPATGRITDVYGSNMDTIEEYTCDYCGTKFKVYAKVQFTTALNEKFNFNTNYTTNLKSDTLILEED